MYNKLKEITEGIYPFHMPGHKRNPEFLRECPDITEITGADDLHHPEGILRDSQSRAARLFGVKRTLYSTCGSTAAILAAVGAVTKGGDRMLIARNCHKSVYNAAYINNLKTEYIMPDTVDELDCFGTVSPSAVERALKSFSARAVVITSPTYEGFVSDIKEISEISHKYGALLIVDAAHGAHLGFSEYFPPSARHLGADIVIESAHKTLPALTGAALLHICSERVDETRLKTAFSIYNSSSPSYPIMASIDAVLDTLKYRGADLLKRQSDRLDDLLRECRILNNLSVFRRDDLDKSKILIVCKNSSVSGFELKAMLLSEHKIECEMAMPNYVLCISTIADTALGFDRLRYALAQLDRKIGCVNDRPSILPLPKPYVKISMRQALEAEAEALPHEFATGRISAEFVYAYPPGSPIIAPGEVITAPAQATIKALIEQGANVYSSGGDIKNIKVVKTE